MPLDNLVYTVGVSDQSTVSGMNSSDPATGVLLNAVPGGANTGAAEHIRLLHDRFPAMSNVAIANKVGCAESNVRQVLGKYVRDCSLEELRDFQANQADIFDGLASSTLASITQADLEKASLLQKVTASAILVDKSRLVRGQPTSIHVTALMDVAELMRRREDEE